MKVAVMGADGKKIVRTEPQKRRMTIQDLLRHTAGLTYGRRGDSEVHRMYPVSSNRAAENLSADEFLARLGKLPLYYQPGTRWDYSFSFDVLGLAIEAVTHEPLGRYMHDNLFGPLGMVDTAFVIAPEKAHRYAQPLPLNPETGERQRIRDVRKPGRFDCGGGCASYTAADYLRFAQMLLDKGSLGGVRILSRKSVEYMTSDQLGAGVDRTQLREYPNLDGYGFGLGVAVREATGVSTFMGSPGDFHWSGANGTYFDVDPKEQLVVVFMAHTPGEPRFRYRQLINALALQAIDD
jgi:CubicO group peptidase (beta-lactamase class C family)